MSAVDGTLIGLITVAVLIMLASAIMWGIEHMPDHGTRAFRSRPEKPLRPEDAETIRFVRAARYDALADYARDTDWLRLPVPDDDYRDPGINGPRFRPWQLVGALHDRPEHVPRPGQDAGRGSSRPGAQAAASRPFSRLPAAALTLLRRDRPARFWSAQSMTECAQTAALLALAESILAGGAA